MKRSLAVALVAAVVLAGAPAVSADEEAPPASTTTTTTTVPETTTTTTVPETTTTTTVPESTTTTTVPESTTTTTVAPDPADPASTEPDPMAPSVVDPAAESESVEPSAEEEDEAGEDPFFEPGVPKRRVRRVNVVRDIVFPLVGPSAYSSSFGNCRDNCEREHHGNDLMTYGWKGVPVVAAHDGRIRLIRDDGEWCNIEITGRDRWYTRYVHLNNDTPGYDDRDYECVVPGIERGTWVEAGQIIGWVGDSGNAEHTPPHLHFEIRMPSGLPVDPYKSLKAAEKIRFYRNPADDPITAAADLANYAYSGGSNAVNIMAVDDYELLQSGGFTALDLSMPLLLAEEDHLTQTTEDALDQFNPDRIIIIGDGLRQAVVDQLGMRIPIVERTAMPAPNPESYVEPDTGVVVDIPEPEPAPFSLVIVGDASDIPDNFSNDLAEMAWRLPMTVFDTDSAARRPIGADSSRSPGKSGRRTTLYYPTGDGYERFSAKEPPENPPDYGVFVLEARRTSEAALTFFESIVDLPVVPFWR
ncbi:MAG: M23 family metallopeptidase [Acidimicrobiia bacterium]